MTEYYHIKDGVLEAYTGREEEITVPEGIHTVGRGAFKGCVSLRKAVLPRGLVRIMGDAFKGCRKLEEVEIPEGVAQIGSYAFHRCHALRRVCLPLSVEEVGDCAFLYCDSLEEVRMPGVRRIGQQAFSNDISVERLCVSRDLETEGVCDVFTGCGKVTEISFSDGTCLHLPGVVEAAAGGVELPPPAEWIVRDILRMMELEGRCMLRFLVNIKHVEVPEGIERLGAGCFFDMRGILSVKLPASLREIGSRAFRNCINLEQVSFACAGVEICEDAFKNCTSLKRVRTWDGGEYAFTGLSGVRPAAEGEEVPEEVRIIQRQILGNFRISGTMLLKYLGAESRVAVPEGITVIAEEAFAGKENIEKVLLPESLREIGAEAFRDCLLLQTVSLPEGLCRIGAGAFENCVKLLRVSLPAGIRRLEARTFCRCRALQEVELPEGLWEIGESAFYGAEALKKVKLPEGLGVIGKMAFYRCSGLGEVRIPASAECVGSLAFAKSGLRRAWISGGRETGKAYEEDVFGGCTRLRTLVLEEGVRHVPHKLAYGCTALRQVVLPGTLESAGRHPFEGTAFLEDWRARRRAERSAEPEAHSEAERGPSREPGPHSEAERGRSREPGPHFGVEHGESREPGPYSGAEHGGSREPEAHSEAEHGPSREPDAAYFWDGRDLEGAVRLPDGVRIVAGGAFYGNTKVTEVYLPDSVAYVGAGAFKGCRGLLRAVLPAGIRDAEAELFSGCAQLEEVLTRDGTRPAWRFVGRRAFYQCGRLGRVLLGEAESIGDEALAGCTLLEETGLRAGVEAEPETEGKPGAEAGPGTEGKTGEEAEPGTKGKTGEEAESETEKRPGAEAEPEVEKKPGAEPGLWIGERAFEDTKFLEKVLDDAEDHVVIIGGIAVAGDRCRGAVRLPEGVLGIAPYAFAGNRRLTGLALPESLRWIGEGAFVGCSGLEDVEFPEGLSRIEARAFEKCASLREVRVFVPEIGKSAFAGCVSLARARLAQVSVLEERLFAGCVRLRECVCPEAEEVRPFCFSGCVRLTEVHLRAARWHGVSAQGAGERGGAGLEEVRPCAADRCGTSGQRPGERGKAGPSVPSPSGSCLVGAYAFAGCESLACGEFPDGTCLEKHAFEDCCGLEKIVLGGERGEIYLREYALCGASALREVVCRGETWRFSRYGDILSSRFPETVRLIFHSAFSCFQVEGEEKLLGYRGTARAVRIPEGIRQIGAEVFRNAAALERVEIPESVDYIGARAFHGTPWMERRREESPMVRVRDMLLDGSGCVGEVVVTEDIRLVCGWAFANGMGIERIRFTSGRVRVEEYAFRNCIFLREIELWDSTCVQLTGIGDRERALPPLAEQAVRESYNCFKTDGEGVLMECTGNISRLRLAYGITAIGEGAFQEGNLLTEIQLPETVETIGRRAFAGCKWLREVKSARGVERIGEMGFSGCGALERVELSERFRHMGAGAFENCTSLREILIPEGVEEIPERAFFRCHSLKSVRLPSTLKRIGREAFAFCGALSPVEVPEGVQVEERAFLEGGRDDGMACYKKQCRVVAGPPVSGA